MASINFCFKENLSPSFLVKLQNHCIFNLIYFFFFFEISNNKNDKNINTMNIERNKNIEKETSVAN